MASTAFDERLTRLSRRERTAFVGALLTARGWDTEVDAPLVRARKGDLRQTVAVAPEGVISSFGRTLPRTSVDVVVGVDTDRTQGLADARDADAWDARTLYDMARHGLDPTATDRLFEEYFGATSEAVDPPFPSEATLVASEAERGDDSPESTQTPRPRPSDSPTDDAPPGRLRRWDVPLLVVLLVVALFGGAIAAQALVGVSPAGDATGDLDTGAVNGDENDRRSETPASTTPEPRTVLPGLTDSGISDMAVLAQGHATALKNRSFTMHITYTERVDDETVGTAREVVRAENATVYRSNGTESGDLAADLTPVIVRDLYADGEGRYLQQGDDYTRVGNANASGTGQVVERSRALVGWYLSAMRSSLVERVQRGDQTYYRVAVEGTTDRRVANYRATGLVSEQGLVVRVEATYRLPESGRVASVSIRHVNVGETTVDRPDWLPPATERASAR